MDDMGEIMSSETGVIVTPPHRHFSLSRLQDVITKMARLGQPMIRAYYDSESDTWLCEEGTHRLRAAKLVGAVPIMIPTA